MPRRWLTRAIALGVLIAAVSGALAWRDSGGETDGTQPQAADVPKAASAPAGEGTARQTRIHGPSNFCGEIEWGPESRPFVGRNIVAQGTECRPARELVRQVHDCILRNLNCSPAGFRCLNDSDATQTLQMSCYGLRKRAGITTRISRVDWTFFGF
jgi:hypothetical protein